MTDCWMKPVNAIRYECTPRVLHGNKIIVIVIISTKTIQMYVVAFYLFTIQMHMGIGYLELPLDKKHSTQTKRCFWW